MEHLSRQQQKVFDFVLSCYPATARDVVGGLGIGRSSAHYTLNRLIEKGYIVAGYRPANGRDLNWIPSPLAALTAEGAGL